jgi:threonine aldolase
LIKTLARQGIKINDEELDGKAVRFVTAWNTSEAEVDDLLTALGAQL